MQQRLAGELPARVEVAAGRDAQPAHRREPSRERARVGALAGVDHGVHVGVRRDAERHPLALAIDHEPRGDRLDAARRQPRHDLLPQHRADLVAVEAVEDAPGLLRVDQVDVEVA